MKSNKKGAIAVIVMGGVFLVTAIVFLILSFTLNLGGDSYIGFWVVAGACGFLGLFCLFFGIYQLSLAKKREAVLTDTSTLAYQTYGKGGNYVRFIAYLNKDESDADRTGRTVAKNVLGAVTLVTLGFGVFGTASGPAPIDVFVSPEEIILKPQSNDLSNAAFRRIPVAGIVNIMYQVDIKHEKVFIVLQGGRLTLDIPVRTTNDRAYVHSVFDKLKKPVAAPVQQIAEEQPVAQEESEQEAPAGSDDVFGI